MRAPWHVIASAGYSAAGICGKRARHRYPQRCRLWIQVQRAGDFGPVELTDMNQVNSQFPFPPERELFEEFFDERSRPFIHVAVRLFSLPLLGVLPRGFVMNGALFWIQP